jgi:Tfp pilus assembly protein PilV
MKSVTMQTPLRRGVTLLELVFATAILVVALVAIFSLILKTQDLQRVSTERSLARVVLEAKVAELRSQLRSAPNDAAGTAFSDLLGTIGAVDPITGVAGPLVTDVKVVGDSSKNAGNDAQMSVTAYTAESNAQIQLGLAGLDIDADGTTGTPDVHPAADLKLLPVKVALTWKPSNWTPGDPPISIELSALLY